MSNPIEHRIHQSTDPLPGIDEGPSSVDYSVPSMQKTPSAAWETPAKWQDVASQGQPPEHAGLYEDARNERSGTETRPETRLPDDTPDLRERSSLGGKTYGDVDGSGTGAVEPPPSLASQQGQLAGVTDYASGGGGGGIAGAVNPDTKNIPAPEYPQQSGVHDAPFNYRKDSGDRDTGRAEYRKWEEGEGDGTSQGGAKLGDKIVGNVQKIAGKITRNPELQEKGEMRKTGENAT